MTKAEPAWETALVGVFDEHQRRYGTRWLQAELRTGAPRDLAGPADNPTPPRPQTLQLKAFTPRTTNSTHGKSCALNLLLD